MDKKAIGLIILLLCSVSQAQAKGSDRGPAFGYKQCFMHDIHYADIPPKDDCPVYDHVFVGDHDNGHLYLVISFGNYITFPYTDYLGLTNALRFHGEPIENIFNIVVDTEINPDCYTHGTGH
ncbi:hypothetical protein [Marinicella sp. W31]|uniref:hypothetical protein n=1 Tax=Marinicella sp. W31 TaxID=3023713 RepID=UPI0037569204